MQYLSADVTTLQRVCQTPSRDKSNPNTSSSTLQPCYHNQTNTRGFLSEQCPKANQNTPDPHSKLASYNHYSDQQEASEEVKEEWPEIKLIVGKISKLEISLTNEKKRNKELLGMLKLCELKLKAQQQDMKIYSEEVKRQAEKYQSLQDELKDEQENNRLKDEELAKSKETLSEVQMSFLKRIAEMEEKLKKTNNQTKQLIQKLRRSNMELEKQRNLNRQLKKQMSAKIQNMQSSKESYLIEQIQNLKTIINSTKDQKECKYLQKIASLNRKIYQYQEELRTNNIQINLMERKKQQAVKEVCDKKDQEMKIQKTMFKSLNEKLAKMQEDFKKLKKENSEIPRNHRLNASHKHEEEFLLELSPEKC